MASEHTNDPILDLLFEELDNDERDELRAEVEGDPELAGELESFEQLLGRVRDADLTEDVPDSVHASIMEAARAGVSRSADGPRAARRGPRTEGSLWQRMTGGSGQIALVATVLLAGAFVFRFVAEEEPMPIGDSAEAPLTQMAPAREANDGMAPEVTDKAALDDGRGVEDLELAEAETYAPTRDDAFAEDSPLEDAIAAKPEEEILPGAKENGPAAEPKPTASRRARRPSSRSVKQNTANKKAGELENLMNTNDDIFGGDAPSAPAKQVPAPRSSSSGVTATTKKVDAKSAESKVDYLGIDELDSAPKDDSDAPAVAAAEGAAQEERQQAYEPPAGTPAAIQQTFDSRDYNRTVSEANDYLSGEAGNSTDRATVMQLKAQSLYNLGRFEQARNVYNSIRRSYPNFRPDQVSQALSEIDRRLDRSKKRKAKPSPRKQESYDFSDDQVEEAAPSSLY